MNTRSKAQIRNKKLKNVLYVCLAGGLLSLIQCFINYSMAFGYYLGWWFCPNILIIGILSQCGAVLGLKGNKIGSILCIISGLSGIISIIAMGGFIYLYFPFYIIGNFFSLIGGFVYIYFERKLKRSV